MVVGFGSIENQWCVVVCYLIGSSCFMCVRGVENLWFCFLGVSWSFFIVCFRFLFVLVRVRFRVLFCFVLFCFVFFHLLSFVFRLSD